MSASGSVRPLAARIGDAGLFEGRHLDEERTRCSHEGQGEDGAGAGRSRHPSLDGGEAGAGAGVVGAADAGVVAHEVR